MRRLATRKTQSEEAVLHVIGLLPWASAPAPAPRGGCRWWPGGRPVVASLGIPRAAMNPAVSGGRSVEPVTEEDF